MFMGNSQKEILKKRISTYLSSYYLTCFLAMQMFIDVYLLWFNTVLYIKRWKIFFFFFFFEGFMVF